MKTYPLIAVLAAVVSTAFAYSPGSSGFQFLKMHVGARASAVGGAFVAVPGDVTALFYNPAGIAGIEQKSASFSYQDDLLDLNSGFIGYVHPGVGPGNLGGSVLFRDYGNFTRTDISGQELGSFGANSVALAVSYGLSPMENLSVGVGAKYLRGAIDTYSADAVAVDLGAMYAVPSQQLVFAAGLFNVGNQVSAYIAEKYPLPLQLRVGLSKKLAHLPLMLMVNGYKYNDTPWYWALGGEFTLTPVLFLRFGYDSFGRDLGIDSSKDTLAGASVGMGFIWNNLAFDYSFSTLGALGSLNRFSISGRF